MPPGTNPAPIRVVLVDDSAYLRLVYRRALQQEPDLEVVGEARDGLEALEVIAQTNPDVLTLDVEMPRLDGLATLRRLMVERPRPVVMVSSLTTEGAAVTIRALELGAVDFVAKPDPRVRGALDEMIHLLIAKLRIAAGARIRGQGALGQTPVGRPRLHPPFAGVRTTRSVVVIGCSTGGPRALTEIVPHLDPALPASFVVVQHMPAGFTRSLAERLDQSGAIRVKEAEDNDSLEPGRVLVAPGDRHLIIGPRTVALSQAPRLHGVRPAVDVTLQSAATAHGRRTVAVILTGMGSDGADGAVAVRAAGGRVIAEDPATCVVDGMPRVVRERGLADAVLPLSGIADGIARFVLER